VDKFNECDSIPGIGLVDVIF